MTVQPKEQGGWVGRAIRRLEDPALVVGQGSFTADLPAHMLGALRAQRGGRRSHRAHHGARPAPRC